MAFENNILDFDVLTVVHLPWIPAAQAGLYVLTSDSRLSDARTPLAHTHAASDIIGFSALKVLTNNVLAGTRSAINLLGGVNGIIISAVDNAGADQVDVTIDVGNFESDQSILAGQVYGF